MSISAVTLYIDAVSHVKLSIEYIPSEEVVYKLLKNSFAQSIPSILAIATQISQGILGNPGPTVLA